MNDGSDPTTKPGTSGANEERGFTWEIDEQEDDEVRVRIRRAGAGEGTVDRTIR